MSNFYSWMFGRNESTAQDEEKIVYRKHPDGSPCYAKDPKDCPIISQHMKADESDDLNDTGIDDAAYMEAVKNGDMETCAKMVREAAAKAMPDTKVIGDDGLPKIVWHGGNFATNGNYKADLSEGEMHFGTKDAAEERISYKYGALKIEDPEGYSHSVSIKPYYLNLKNVKRVDDNDGDSNTWLDWANESDRAFDGVVYKNESEDSGNDSYGVSWNPSLIKSADPVTYDDSGNPIPLSKRFDFTNPDIRY